MAAATPAVTLPAPVAAAGDRAHPAPRPAIRLLGPPLIEAPAEGELPRRAASVELLAYLAFNRGGATSEQLLEVVWPGIEPERSRQRLWQAVSDARRLVGHALVRRNGRYLLDRALVAIDVDELDRLLHAAALAPDGHARPLLERAAALWRDRPLAGAEYHWAEGDIRYLVASYLTLAERLARLQLDGGDPRAALACCERALAHDPLDERLWRLAMQAEAALGLRATLTRRYDTLAGLLAERLGLLPERETRDLYRELLSQG